MHMLEVKTENKTKIIAVFWVTGLIRYASLEYKLYKSWNIKIDYKMDIVNKIIIFLKTKDILETTRCERMMLA